MIIKITIFISIITSLACGKEQNTVPTNLPTATNCILVAPECAPKHVNDFHICGAETNWCAYSCKSIYFTPNPQGQDWRINLQWLKGSCSSPDMIL